MRSISPERHPGLFRPAGQNRSARIILQQEEIETLAQDIRRNVHRASRVIQHVRDFARQSEVGRQKVNINDSIRDVFKVLGHQLTVHEVDLSLDLCDQLPWILADHNRLEQVFINLVTNAMDAMDEKKTIRNGGIRRTA
jgi:C4-dicarboxylate-specific signal transduction histidine kinase